MSARALPALVAALGVFFFSLISIVASSVVGVVSGMGRYPEAMFDYVSPVLASTFERSLVPLLIVGAVVFFGYWLQPISARTRVIRVVLFGLALSVAACFVAGLGLALSIGSSSPFSDGLRALASKLTSQVGVLNSVFLLVAPVIVLGECLLLFWYRSRATAELTEPPHVG